MIGWQWIGIAMGLLWCIAGLYLVCSSGCWTVAARRRKAMRLAARAWELAPRSAGVLRSSIRLGQVPEPDLSGGPLISQVAYRSLPPLGSGLISETRNGVTTQYTDRSGFEVPIVFDPTVVRGGRIQVPGDVDAAELKQRFLTRKANGEPVILEAARTVGITADEAADRLLLLGGHRHRDQEVKLVATGEVVAWWCLDCERTRYADGW